MKLLKSPRIILAISLAAVIGIAGCGSSSSTPSSNSAEVNPNTAEVSPPGDIPDDQVFVAYSPSGASYSVKVPEGWARTANGGSVTFTDKLNSVRMESQPAQAALTPAEAKQSTVPELAKSVKGFKLAGVSTVTRSAGPATLIKYLAQSTPDPVTGKTITDAVERYTFFHNGQSVTLTLTGPDGADNVDPWQIVSDSLRYTR
jgi:hypothetical protein